MLFLFLFRPGPLTLLATALLMLNINQPSEHSTETGAFNFAPIAPKIERALADIRIKTRPQFHSRLTVGR